MTEPAREPTVVLLIEDNPGDVRLVREAFAEAGNNEFKLEVAMDLLAGLQRVDAGGIQVVVSDLNLPDSEGLGAVARLRAHARGIPILVLTGTYDEARGVDALRFGVQDYMLKEEMAPRTLIRAVRYAIERQRTDEALAATNRELARANRALEASRLDLEHRVAERTSELAQANRDLETLLFVATHDLKEPLNAIEAFSEIVSERYAPHLDDKGRDLLRRISRGTRRMRGLLEDLLVLTKAQKIDVPEASVAVENLVAEALGRFTEQIREKGARIRVEKPLPVLRVNRTWVVEACANLISNALKFTDPGSAPDIEIAGYSGVEGVGIVVRDRGTGVPKELSDRIFQLFQRGVSREVEGTGAGLTIVRQIAERHGGHAWVRSRDGGGSEFFVTFAGIEVEAGAVNLLLVDDDEDFIFIMKEQLEGSRMVGRLAVAHDGVEALEYLRKADGFQNADTPDVVLLDINMPRKNGFEVLADMHNDPLLHEIPVAMVTSSVRKEDEARSLAMGASAYLTKPFQFEDLISVVQRLAA